MFAAMWHVLLQLAPWILLGTLIAGLMHGLLPRGLVRRKLQGPAGVVKAVALGVPLPLCSCGVIPAGIGLKKDGASDGASIGFLISTPQTGVDSVLVSASFLGWPFALFKVFSAGTTGIVGGLLVDGLDRRGEGETAEQQSEDSSPSPPGLRGMVNHGLEIIRSIWHWLVLGIVVSAAIDEFVPDSFLTGIGSLGILPSALAALAISLPLYVCATASVPIAAALVAGGLPPGAALVFLMAGPATNVATIGAIYRRFGARNLVVYLATIIVGSVGLAVAFDWLLSSDPMRGSVAHEGHDAWWAQACAVVLVVLLAWYAGEDLHSWWRRHRISPAVGGTELTVSVRGMTCSGCASRLENALLQTEGVETAVVHLEPGQAIVRGSIDQTEVCDVIRKAGFQTE
jgi:uncharacterized membrane protein YraQ (UPF0718 family)/copper chaperone CopZ